MSKTKTETTPAPLGRKARRAKRPPSAKRTVRAKRPGPAAFDRASELADLTAAAWVSVIGSRVRELARVVGRVVYLSSHPDEARAGAALAQRLDLRRFGVLSAAIDRAEMAVLEGLLNADVTFEVPDLAGACRALADADVPGREAGARP